VAHTPDVDGMLSQIEPRQFFEWIAEHELEPWGDDWRQAGTIAAANENALAPVHAYLTGEVPPMKQARDYYRWSKKGKSKENRYLTPEESLHRDRMLCGV
jgi:hypothetical protein